MVWEAGSEVGLIFMLWGAIVGVTLRASQEGGRLGMTVSLVRTQQSLIASFQGQI